MLDYLVMMHVRCVFLQTYYSKLRPFTIGIYVEISAKCKQVVVIALDMFGAIRQVSIDWEVIEKI